LAMLMRALLISLILISALAIGGFGLRTPLSQAAAPQAQAASLTGRWRVKFALSGDSEKNLVFESNASGSGSFLLLDTGPGDKPVTTPAPAVWSQLPNDRVSFSGDAELPLGTCCREVGTLIFKGKFESNSSISGKLIFVTSVEEEESPYKYHSLIGSFAATRLLGK